MDLHHLWTGDLSAAPNGDLATADGFNLGMQRVLRRLMTAQGEYIWHPDYGAGLPQRIGNVRDDRVIAAIVRAQIFKEICVARSPTPKITLQSMTNGLIVTIRYFDRFAQKAVTVTFPVQARPYAQSQQAALSVEVPS
ncbi:phage tail protein [Methylovirgula sp. 4M-Z18]|uniref:phage tail protein n=1 Tax=Methylovirgula sp. 4M-Z18 TaxID=2293567 RepID=UPI000E2F55B3|nr:phage tail protein [Methylovirgula sp. 4M-Z18]RFB80026.1 phage tail protein [Methylovirgula sp. 4M-Z18]